jgi:DNA-binding XRE family transcriptional regulator
MSRAVKSLKPHDELLAEDLAADVEFRAEWQRTALAREVAAELVRYRAERGLSQRALAVQLGVSQPRVVELESGERNPRIETLIAIARATGLEFTIDIGPAARAGRGVTKALRDRHPAVIHGDVSVVVSAS